MKMFDNLRIKFYYNPKAENKCRAICFWYEDYNGSRTTRAKGSIDSAITYSQEALKQFIKENFEEGAEHDFWNIDFQVESADVGYLIKYCDGDIFNDINDIVEFDKQCGFHGALVNECKSHLEERQKQASETLSEIEASLAKVE